MNHSTNTYIRGIGLIEAVVVISIMSTAFAAILGAAVFFLRGGLVATQQTQAVALLEEGVEAVRFMRDQGYTTNIAPLIGAGVRYLDPSAGGWTVTTTDSPIFGIFTRTITLANVYRRNSDDDIVPSTSAEAKTLDPGTAQLTVTVSWGDSTVQGVTYIADIYEN